MLYMFYFFKALNCIQHTHVGYIMYNSLLYITPKTQTNSQTFVGNIWPVFMETVFVKIYFLLKYINHEYSHAT
jgi:hypothetical protein